MLTPSSSPFPLQLACLSLLRSLDLKLHRTPFPSTPPFFPQLARLPQLCSLDLQQGLAGGVPEQYIPALRQLAPLTALTRLRLRVVYGGPSGGLRVRWYWGEELTWGRQVGRYLGGRTRGASLQQCQDSNRR